MEFGSDEIEYVAEAISKQRVEEVASFLLTAFGKLRGERYELMMELLGKKGSRIKRFGKFSAYLF